MNNKYFIGDEYAEEAYPIYIDMLKQRKKEIKDFENKHNGDAITKHDCLVAMLFDDYDPKLWKFKKCIHRKCIQGWIPKIITNEGMEIHYTYQRLVVPITAHLRLHNKIELRIYAFDQIVSSVEKIGDKIILGYHQDHDTGVNFPSDYIGMKYSEYLFMKAKHEENKGN